MEFCEVLGKFVVSIRDYEEEEEDVMDKYRKGFKKGSRDFPPGHLAFDEFGANPDIYPEDIRSRIEDRMKSKKDGLRDYSRPNPRYCCSH